jgi:hypothetical protein
MDEFRKQILDTEGNFDKLQSRSSVRKARLFSVACCNLLTPWITESTCRLAIKLSEQFADGKVGKHVLAAARKAFAASERMRLRRESEIRGLNKSLRLLRENVRPIVWSATWDACHYAVRADAWDAARLCQRAVRVVLQSIPADVVEKSLPQFGPRSDLPTGILEDIFGNSFSPVEFDSRWRTSDVLGLARAIYDDKAFERMPILADALMDAGCEDEQVIAHCRGERPHVRGCWVVDLVLGKQ